jgi:hypothetical protein
VVAAATAAAMAATAATDRAPNAKPHQEGSCGSLFSCAPGTGALLRVQVPP